MVHLPSFSCHKNFLITNNKYNSRHKTMYQQYSLELFGSVISNEEVNPKLLPELGVFASVPRDLVTEVETYFNNKLSFDALNNSFYRTWEKVENITEEQRLVDQIFHYFTAYVNDLVPGIVNVYYPEQEEPVNNGRMTINYVGTLREEEAFTRCINLLNTPAIKTENLVKVFAILKGLGYTYPIDTRFLNKEAQCLFYDEVQVLPTDGEELFRYLFYKATGTTLVVNSKKMAALIESSGYELPTLNHYQKVQLSRRFLTVRRLWLLGFRKAHPNNKRIVNSLSRLADNYHTPKGTAILLQLTSNPNIKKEELVKAANACTITQLIKAINALRVYSQDCTDHLYRIRNGTSYVVTKEGNTRDKGMYGFYHGTLVEVLKERVGKLSIHHEPYISYSLNLSDKQKIGHIPTGTRISIPEGEGNLYIGIHWYNQQGEEVDLDIKAHSAKDSVGWNNQTRLKGIEWTGDVIVPHPTLGATEWFKITGSEIADDYIIRLSSYAALEVFKFKLLIGYSDKEFTTSDSNQVMSLDNVILETEITSSQREYTIGLLTADKEFYFLGANSGNARVSSHSQPALNAAITACKSTLRLNDIFDIISNPEEADINLSLNKLSIDSFNFIQ